jgi:hypothetical protein
MPVSYGGHFIGGQRHVIITDPRAGVAYLDDPAEEGCWVWFFQRHPNHVMDVLASAMVSIRRAPEHIQEQIRRARPHEDLPVRTPLTADQHLLYTLLTEQRLRRFPGGYP